MFELFLIISLSVPPHGYNTIIIPVDNMDECHKRGKSAVSKLEIIRNPDSYMNRSVLRSAKYECLKL